MISQIKSPAVIVVIVIFGLFVVGGGLIVVLGSLDQGDKTFVRDPNPDYNRTVVPELKITGVSKYDTNGSAPVSIAYDPLGQAVELGQGEFLQYTIEVSNIGTQRGEINIFFHPSSSTENKEQWYPILPAPDDAADIISVLRTGTNPFEPGGIPEDTRTPETTRADGDQPPKVEPGDDDTVGGGSAFEQLLYGQGLTFNMSSKQSASFSVIVATASEIQPDMLTLIVTAYHQAEPDMTKFYEVGELGNYWNGPQNVLFDVVPINVASNPPTGAVLPRDQIDIELVEISNSKTTKKASDIHGPGDIPKLTWDKKMTTKIRVTNTAASTRYVVAFYGVLEPIQPNSIGDLSMFDAKGQTEIPPGESREIELTFKPDRSLPEREYSMGIALYVSDTEVALPDRYSSGDMFGKDSTVSMNDEIENRGETLAVLSHPVYIESKHYEKIDETADFFFFIYFTGGIPIPIIFLAVLAGSGLIANDRSHKTMSLYYSKAMPRYGYFVGKFLGLGLLLFIATVVTTNLWFMVVMALGGFSTKFVIDHLEIMGFTTIFGLLISLFLSSIVLAGSSLGKNKYMVGASVLALFLLFPVITSILSAITRYKKMVLISPTHNIQAIGLKIFGLRTPDVDWRLSALALVIVFAGAIGLLIFRLVIQEEVAQ